MATNMSDIGFAIQNGDELETLARQCFEKGKAQRCPQGTYIVWNIGQGVELWAQLNQKEELIALNPHFAGRTRLSAGLMSRVARDGFPMDGGFRALAQPYGNDPIEGSFEFVFDVPDFHLHDSMALPVIHSVQMCAFAQQCALYENEGTFQTHVARRGTKLLPDTFTPLGYFDSHRQPLPEPLASAMICGKILECGALYNSVSGVRFNWMRIRNAAGDMDVLADQDLLPRGSKVGAILQCSAWLSGRIV